MAKDDFTDHPQVKGFLAYFQALIDDEDFREAEELCRHAPMSPKIAPFVRLPKLVYALQRQQNWKGIIEALRAEQLNAERNAKTDSFRRETVSELDSQICKILLNLSTDIRNTGDYETAIAVLRCVKSSEFSYLADNRIEEKQTIMLNHAPHFLRIDNRILELRIAGRIALPNAMPALAAYAPHIQRRGQPEQEQALEETVADIHLITHFPDFALELYGGMQQFNIERLRRPMARVAARYLSGREMEKVGGDLTAYESYLDQLAFHSYRHDIGVHNSLLEARVFLGVYYKRDEKLEEAQVHFTIAASVWEQWLPEKWDGFHRNYATDKGVPSGGSPRQLCIRGKYLFLYGYSLEQLDEKEEALRAYRRALSLLEAVRTRRNDRVWKWRVRLAREAVKRVEEGGVLERDLIGEWEGDGLAEVVRREGAGEWMVEFEFGQ